MAEILPRYASIYQALNLIFNSKTAPQLTQGTMQKRVIDNITNVFVLHSQQWHTYATIQYLADQALFCTLDS